MAASAVRARCISALSVNGNRYRFEMGWIAALAVSAEVIDLISARDCASRYLVSRSMGRGLRPAIASFDSEHPVAV
jgi:hypothetical protein